MLQKIFTWWNSSTLGTQFTLWRRGARLVGTDEQGNRYFEEKTGSAPDGGGRKRRWVVYHGVAEASRVPPDWHGWLHHTFEEPPTVKPLTRRAFEKDHMPNMTGTPLAYHPPGSLFRPEGAKGVGPDYEAWSPDAA
ncbi:MAG: NADH:ubiquinone oxidoreductase subunit NDUFA12 [Alphaproteobacteria bacterium]|nr:NADH:ubiquinone oxidoreductase subunit NDUFA12 [Alphaproteobacteria bacterium]